MSETHNLLDLEDVHLRQLAGSLDTEHPTTPLSSPIESEENVKVRHLFTMLAKISNYLTSGDALNRFDFFLPSGQRPFIGVTQEKLLERWNVLASELRQWRDSVPLTFSECARLTSASSISGARNPPSPPSPSETFEQIWYELPMAAATMQNYHMARILLLVNQPHSSTVLHSSLSARLRSYQYVQQEARRHAREICGISLACPCEAVQVQSILPLFVAGQVFDTLPEQELSLRLLRQVEKNSGWDTSYHVAKLSEEWERGSGDIS